VERHAALIPAGPCADIALLSRGIGSEPGSVPGAAAQLAPDMGSLAGRRAARLLAAATLPATSSRC